MHGAHELGRGETGRPRRRSTFVGWAHPDDALGVVAIGATFEQREGAEGKSPDAVQRRRRDLGERWQWRDDLAQPPDVRLVEERKLSVLRHDLGLRLRLDHMTINPEDHGRALTLQLDRPAP